MSPQQNQTFLQKHLVTIIMIPVIIGVHYGWNYLQYNRALVPAEEQRELPIFSILKAAKRKLKGENDLNEHIHPQSTSANE